MRNGRSPYQGGVFGKIQEFQAVPSQAAHFFPNRIDAGRFFARQAKEVQVVRTSLLMLCLSRGDEPKVASTK
jgi:hypothetical protein